jgi:hypothetical protein
MKQIYHWALNASAIDFVIGLVAAALLARIIYEVLFGKD